jgi:hypothetical protein
MPASGALPAMTEDLDRNFQQAEASGPKPHIFTKFAKKNDSWWTPERLKFLRLMWRRGASTKAIAEVFGVSLAAIDQLRLKHEAPVRKLRQAPRTKRAHGRPRIERVAFETSRLMEFCTRRELENQTAHRMEDWPRVVIKELIDNALDACEEAEIAPVINITITSSTKLGSVFVVEDNGPGIPAATIAGIIDYTTRTSSREAYVSPTRGAQGNALKTILPMGYVLQSKAGAPLESTTLVEARGTAHTIRFSVDRIRMEPMVEHTKAPSDVRTGTRVTVLWPYHRLGDGYGAVLRIRSTVSAAISISV